MIRPTKQHSQKGVAAVEFALTIVFVMVLIFWIFELMMFIYSYSVMAAAAKEGVRYGEVRGCGAVACADTTAITQQVKNFAQLSFHDVSAMDVKVTYPAAPAGSWDIRVVVTYTYKPYLSLGFLHSINAAAQGHVAN
jgi:Flp pilus assembly protein TadG